MAHVFSRLYSAALFFPTKEGVTAELPVIEILACTNCESLYRKRKFPSSWKTTRIYKCTKNLTATRAQAFDAIAMSLRSFVCLFKSILVSRPHKCIVTQSICVVWNVAKLLRERSVQPQVDLSQVAFIAVRCLTGGLLSASKYFRFPSFSEIIFQFTLHALVHDKTTTKKLKSKQKRQQHKSRKEDLSGAKTLL